MSLESELVTRLEDDAGVGAVAGNRIYPINLPQNPTLPAVTYQRITGPRLRHLTGASGRGDARIQIDCWAVTYGAGKSLAAAIQASLHGYIGLLTTVKVAITLSNEIDDYDEDAREWRIIQDYVIQHTD